MNKSGIPIKAFGVSVVVLRNSHEATETLILKRNSPILHRHWCQVAGSTEPGESGWQTAVRELKEETGLIPERLYAAAASQRASGPGPPTPRLRRVRRSFAKAEARIRDAATVARYQSRSG
jgi:dATP pyrophosphohydrolase